MSAAGPLDIAFTARMRTNLHVLLYVITGAVVAASARALVAAPSVVPQLASATAPPPLPTYLRDTGLSGAGSASAVRCRRRDPGDATDCRLPRPVSQSVSDLQVGPRHSALRCDATSRSPDRAGAASPPTADWKEHRHMGTAAEIHDDPTSPRAAGSRVRYPLH